MATQKPSVDAVFTLAIESESAEEWAVFLGRACKKDEQLEARRMDFVCFAV